MLPVTAVISLSGEDASRRLESLLSTLRDQTQRPLEIIQIESETPLVLPGFVWRCRHEFLTRDSFSLPHALGLGMTRAHTPVVAFLHNPVRQLSRDWIESMAWMMGKREIDLAVPDTPGNGLSAKFSCELIVRRPLEVSARWLEGEKLETWAARLMKSGRPITVYNPSTLEPVI